MFLSKKNRAVIAISIGIICYFITGYFLDRTNYFQLTVQYLILCIIFWYVITTEKNNFTLLLALSILFRLIFLFAIPNLSQDFYRFIWDGRMIFEAINPYESLPETFIKNEAYPINQTIDLYDGMGSLNGSHYTNYPPLNQLSFVIAAIFAKTSILWSVVVMRLQIILADIGIIYIGKKILEKLNMPIHHIFLYALNPFIIIELTGNLHFEAVMLFFLVWSLYLLLQKKWIWSAFIFGLSVSVKLIPLLFIPLFYQWFTKDGKSKGVLNFFSFGAIIIGINMLLFLPFLSSNLLDNYLSSVGLWFQNFEFNASVYYIAREIGYLFRGWNEIAIIGKILPIITVVFLIVITFFRKNNSSQQLFTAMLLGLTFYYFMATTVHPWYIASLVLLSVFTKYNYPIVWSIVIILSYQAYANNPWQENLWLITLEYLLVYGFLFWEIIQLKKGYLSRE